MKIIWKTYAGLHDNYTNSTRCSLGTHRFHICFICCSYTLHTCHDILKFRTRLFELWDLGPGPTYEQHMKIFKIRWNTWTTNLNKYEIYELQMHIMYLSHIYIYIYIYIEIYVSYCYVYCVHIYWTVIIEPAYTCLHTQASSNNKPTPLPGIAPTAEQKST